MRYLSGLIGLLLLVGFISFLAVPIETIKWLGAPFLIIPSALGIYHPVSSAEVWDIALYGGDPQIDITAPGPYTLYSNDTNVLMRANMLDDMHSVWITLKSVDGQREISGTNVTRGVRPYDSVAVRGRPIVLFEVAQAGAYDLTYSRQSGQVTLIRDDSVGRESTLVLVMLAQPVVLALIVTLAYLPRIRKQLAQRRALDEKLAQKRAATEAFWRKRE